MRTLRVAQVVPEVVSKVTEQAELSVVYNGTPISNGENLSPSETQVLCVQANGAIAATL